VRFHGDANLNSLLADVLSVEQIDVSRIKTLRIDVVMR